MKTFRAYVLGSGVIGFTSDRIPKSALIIAQHDNETSLRDTIGGLARRGYVDNLLLVPGIPEAENDEAAFNAFVRFRDIVSKVMQDIEKQRVRDILKAAPKRHNRGRGYN